MHISGTQVRMSTLKWTMCKFNLPKCAFACCQGALAERERDVCLPVFVFLPTLLSLGQFMLFLSKAFSTTCSWKYIYIYSSPSSVSVQLEVASVFSMLECCKCFLCAKMLCVFSWWQNVASVFSVLVGAAVFTYPPD